MMYCEHLFCLLKRTSLQKNRKNLVFDFFDTQKRENLEVLDLIFLNSKVLRLHEDFEDELYIQNMYLNFAVLPFKKKVVRYYQTLIANV